MRKQDPNWMHLAFDEALNAKRQGEVPVGAVLVIDNQLIAKSGNQVIKQNDPTAHAETVVIRQAAEILGQVHLVNACLYVTLEPCTMCAGAISLARIKNLYYGSYDAKGGGVDHGSRFFDQKTCHHKPQVYSGIMEKECETLLKDFFAQLR